MKMIFLIFGANLIKQHIFSKKTEKENKHTDTLTQKVHLPAAMAQHLIPSEDKSRAMGSVIDAMHPLLAANAMWPTPPSKAWVEVRLTITPFCPSSSGAFWDISPTDRRIVLKVPTVFTW